MNNPDALPDVKPENRNSFTVPTPPSPDMGVRTMSSDASSLRSPGGMSTEPKAFNPKDLLGSEPVYNPSAGNNGDTLVLPPEPQPHKNKKLIIGVGIGVFLILVGIVGYFILWPLISRTFLSPAPAPAPEPVPVVVVIPPPAPVEPQPVPPAFQHATLFPQASAVSSVNILLPALNVDGINNGIKQSFGPSVPVSAFNEVSFYVDPGGVVDAYEFLGTLVPSVSANLSSVISQDFTGFVYKDKDGVWPGYVFALRSADATTEPNLSFVNNTQLSSKIFYTNDPGAEKFDFRNGAKPSPNFVWVRYKQYTAAGASFNIGQVTVNGNNYLILSTSYQGFQMASQKLGF